MEEYIKVMEEASNAFAAAGIMQTLVEVFKTGRRDDLLSAVNVVFGPIFKTEIKSKFMQKRTILTKSRVALA